MKHLFKIFFLLITSVSCMAHDTINYDALLQPSITMWKKECMTQLSTQELNIIADMLLLSYQVVQASIVMSQARFLIQSELFNIVTLSINDTFDARMQAENNDLTKIKNAVVEIEQAQEQIKFACNALQNFGPQLIHIDPIVIQLFIFNLKSVILNWAKYQQTTITDFERIQEEFLATSDLFAHVKNNFQTIILTNPVAHSQLLHGTNSLTNMYKKIEDMIADLTIVRQEGLANFNIILTLYFKYHYQALYDHLQSINNIEFKYVATSDHTLPDPESIFILSQITKITL